MFNSSFVYRKCGYSILCSWLLVVWYIHIIFGRVWVCTSGKTKRHLNISSCYFLVSVPLFFKAILSCHCFNSKMLKKFGMLKLWFWPEFQVFRQTSNHIRGKEASWSQVERGIEGLSYQTYGAAQFIILFLAEASECSFDLMNNSCPFRWKHLYCYTIVFFIMLQAESLHKNPLKLYIFYFEK